MADRARPPVIDLVGPTFDSHTGDAPLYLRLSDHLRELIRDDHLSAGSRLPASRTLARDLALSRTTVELAYDELVTQGFIERRRGSGTYVVDLLPARPARIDASPMAGTPGQAPTRGLSDRGERLATVGRFRDAPHAPAGFAPCLPSEDVFPIQTWTRTLADVMLDQGRDLQRPAPLLGDLALRTAIANHLARTRRVQCTPERLLIVPSTQQALTLLARLLLDPDDAVWLEEPGYLGARAVFQALGARHVPVPVDDDGLDVAAGLAAAPTARLAYVTPSHQYPTGTTLAAERRGALLDWARETGAWIVEDDYDSEFRHVGRPLAPLQSADRDGRVVYIGTFNKALFPGLRLAYLALPDVLVEPAERAIEALGGQPSTLMQAAAAAFVTQGHFAAHLRRSRHVYRDRREVLLEAAREGLTDHVTLGPSDTGLHVCAWLPEGTSDTEISARAAVAGLHVPPLSPCYAGPDLRSGLILGYASVDEHAIRSGLRHLTAILCDAG